MSKKLWIGLIALALVAAAPALAGGSECTGKAAAQTASKGHGCTGDTQYCLNKMATKLKSKGWVGIELDVNEKSGAMTVTRVVPDSPALAGGLQEGDVLVALNGVRFDDEEKEALHETQAQMKPGNTVTYTVERDGYAKKVAVTLAAVPDDVVAQWIGGHMLEHATVEVAAALN